MFPRNVVPKTNLGRVLAKEVVSPINAPSHNNSAMDGYAVRNDDLGAGER